MPDREKKRVPDDRSDILKGSLHKSSCTPLGHGKSANLRLNEEKENRDEATQIGMGELCQKQCGNR